MSRSGDARLGARLPRNAARSRREWPGGFYFTPLRVVQGGSFGPRSTSLTKLDAAWNLGHLCAFSVVAPTGVGVKYYRSCPTGVPYDRGTTCQGAHAPRLAFAVPHHRTKRMAAWACPRGGFVCWPSLVVPPNTPAQVGPHGRAHGAPGVVWLCPRGSGVVWACPRGYGVIRRLFCSCSKLGVWWCSDPHHLAQFRGNVRVSVLSM